MFERGSHVPVTHMGYFKRLSVTLPTNLRSKYRRSAKEWKYINRACIWFEMGLTSLSVSNIPDGYIEEIERLLSFLKRSFKDKTGVTFD